jgi:hypothetical protein
VLRRPVESTTQSGHFHIGPPSNSITTGFRFIVAREIIHLGPTTFPSMRMNMSAESSSPTRRSILATSAAAGAASLLNTNVGTAAEGDAIHPFNELNSQ